MSKIEKSDIAPAVPVFSFEHKREGWYLRIFYSDDKRADAMVLGPFDKRETAQDAYNKYYPLID